MRRWSETGKRATNKKPPLEGGGDGGPMTEKLIRAIEAILKRGNDVEIRRKGDGYIVLEVKKSIKYSA